MIQELLGGSSALIGGEKKLSLPSTIETSFSSSPAATSPPSEKQIQNQNQNLRCPRCDSSNTKFCYYNNYNLTQPRHFCKTCRRYWTKGGALRNVPIGGGCRRGKNVTITSSSHVSGSSGKPDTGVRLKTSTISCEIGNLGFDGYNSSNNLDHLFPSNPILWAPSQTNHIISLLRSNQNPNSNPSCVGMKEESNMSNTQALGLGHFNPFWRSNQAQGEQSLFSLGHENQNSTALITQDLYQRLRSSGNYYQDQHHHSPVLMSSSVSTSSAPSTILESSPIVSGGVSTDLGYWNPMVNWSDLPTTNGAYP